MTDDKKKAKKRESHKAYRDANLEEIRAQRKARYDADPEKYRAQQKEYYAANPEKARARMRAKSPAGKAGWTEGMVLVALRLQKGKCAICTVQMIRGGKRVANSMCRDHCEVANVPRALLCNICNVSLGYYEGHQRAAGLVHEQYEIYTAKYQPKMAA